MERFGSALMGLRVGGLHGACRLPPVAHARSVGSQTYVDYSNQLWLREGWQWVNKGTPPGLVATQSTTWGKIKAQFGGGE